MSNSETPFENFLNKHDEEDWNAAVTELLPSIHEVDRAATLIWFKFYPLKLFRVLESAENQEALVKKLLIQGKYKLADHLDESHKFLYGHRYWSSVKRAVEARAESFETTGREKLLDEIRKVAQSVAAQTKTDESLLAGITAVAFMTLVQAGLPAMKAAPGKMFIEAKQANLSPEKVLAKRARDDSQGLFGFLKTVDKNWTVTYDENTNSAFKIVNEEEIASAAARDQSKDWRAMDERCIEGPIPVECRSAACGTCWVGALGGAEKLADVGRLEGARIKEFGYIETDEKKPLIRLACQARAYGAVSIVIPPWNGFFGKYLKKLESGEEETMAATADVAS
jgi:ferredoxin